MQKLGIVGAKSYPNRYGGFESLLETLVKSDVFTSEFFEIKVPLETFDRVDSEPKNVILSSVQLKKSCNPFKFYWQSLCSVKDCNYILILGLGAGFFLPFYRLVYPKIKFVVNVDGLEWQRGKFALHKRILLFILAIFNILCAHKIVFDNVALVPRFPFGRWAFNKKGAIIAYASRYEGLVSSFDENTSSRNDYILAIARFVPENNVDIICAAYSISNLKSSAELIFVGDVENYAADLRKEYPNVTFTGPIYDTLKLGGLIKNSILYVHGHTVGGTNPALVEAIHLGANLVVHDNPFNRETLFNQGTYFSSVSSLVDILNGDLPNSCGHSKLYDVCYSSRIIAEKYVKVIKTCS